MIEIDDVSHYLENRKLTDYELVQHSETFASTDEFARSAGIDPALVYKTLAVRHKTQVAAICISAASRLDFKRVQAALKWPKVSMARDDDLERIGMTHLGVTPFAECWSSVVLDSSIRGRPRIFIGGGVGYDVSVEPGTTASKLGWIVAHVTV